MANATKTTEAAAPARFAFIARARELILLRDAEATACGYGDVLALRIRALHAAGEQRLRGARRLELPLTRIAECVLLRDALRFYLRARAAAAKSDEDILAGDLGSLEPNVVAALDGPDDHIDSLGDEELAALRFALDAAIVAHRRGVEVRSVTNIRAARIGRLAAIAVVILWALWLVAVKILAPPNLAFGKPVSASSRYPGTPDGAGLVDGDTGGTYAIHTNREDGAWVMVDLQSTHYIHAVKVYNRGDGWFDEGLPLVLELSDDRVTWREVARRTEHFEQHPPWVVDAGGRPARFVRLRVAGHGIVALSELEVFGAR